MSPSSQAKVIIHVNFLMVEETKNPMIGFDAIHHSRLQVHLHEKGSASFSSNSAKHSSPIIKIITMRQVWFFQILFKSSSSLVRSSVHDPSQRPTSLRRPMTKSLQIQGEHVGRRESGRCLSASSGTSVYQGSFNTQFSRKRTSWAYSFSIQIMLRDLSESIWTSWSAQASVSEKVKYHSVGSFLLQDSWCHSETQDSYLHWDHHINVWCCHCSRPVSQSSGSQSSDAVHHGQWVHSSCSLMWWLLRSHETRS